MNGASDTAAAFSTARFRSEREGDWQDFSRLLDRLERGSARALTSEELLRLPVLYRATLSSLSIARATMLDRALLDHLESLAIRGYFLIYGVQERRRDRLVAFFSRDWPRAMARLWRETIIMVLVMVLAIAAGWALVAANPDWFYQLVGADMASGRDPRASAEYLQSTLTSGPEDRGGLHVFATSLFTHNSQVAILAFALGFAFGVPSLLLVFYNGLLLGAMMAVFAKQGLALAFGGWLAIHGTTELFAIALAGAAGLRIGTAVLFPGDSDRMTAAAQAGRSAALAMMGVVVMLLVAGALEGFGRQLINDTALRYAIGAVMLLGWPTYFFAWSRRTAPTAGTQP